MFPDTREEGVQPTSVARERVLMPRDLFTVILSSLLAGSCAREGCPTRALPSKPRCCSSFSQRGAQHRLPAVPGAGAVGSRSGGSAGIPGCLSPAAGLPAERQDFSRPLPRAFTSVGGRPWLQGPGSCVNSASKLAWLQPDLIFTKKKNPN